MTTQATAQQAPTTTNGVNVTALFDTIAAIKADPKLAHFNFRARNRWHGGEKNCTTIKQFTGACQEHRTGAEPFVVWNGEHRFCWARTKPPTRWSGCCMR